MFKGTLVALVTPFLDNINKSVDYGSLEALLEFQINASNNKSNINQNNNSENSNNNISPNGSNINYSNNNENFNHSNIDNKQNIDGLLICASTGEGTLLTNDERIDIIKFVITIENSDYI